jgi:hypothetical protein
MNSQFGFLVKVFLFSAVLSLLVKYGGPLLPLAPTATNALIGVIFPTLATALALGWRARRNANQ